MATTIADERLALRGVVPTHRWLHSRTTLPMLIRLERAVLERSERILAMSHHTANQIVRSGIKASKIEIGRVPIDTRRFMPSGFERRGALFVGRAHDPRKNFALARRALSTCDLLRERGLTVVSAERAPLPEGVASSVTWVPGTTELSDRYNAAELLLLPSLQEGYGIVAFEALACGTPVLALRCGGPDRYLEESGGAVVAESEDEFLSALDRLLKDPVWLDEAGKQGRAYVERHMSAEVFLKDESLFRPQAV